MKYPQRKKPEQPKINGYLLKYKTVRLIDGEGKQLGIVNSRDALSQARTLEVDLVLITETCDPVVARLIDYGKYKYNQAKLAKSNKPKVLEDKRFQVSPTTGAGDIEVVARKIREALEKGHTVTLQCFFRRIQLAHPHLGQEKIDKVLELVPEHEVISQQPLKANKIIVSIKKKK